LFQYTYWEAVGSWSPNAGDTYTSVVLEKAPSGTEDFTDLGGLYGIDGSNAWWFATDDYLHNGAGHHLRAGIRYTTSGGSGIQYSSKTAAIACN
jgi:hypothetical protein